MGEQAGSLTRLAARLLLAACFIPSGLSKAGNVSGFALSLAANGLPYPSALAAGGVLIGVLGPLALALGILPRATGWAMALYTTAMLLLLHRFWDFSGAFRQAEQAIFLANLGIVAGLLLYVVSGPGDWSWQGWSRREPEEQPAPVRRRGHPAPGLA